MIQDSINQMLGMGAVALNLGVKDIVKQQKEARGYIQNIDSSRINAMSQLKKMDADMTPENIAKLSPTERENAISRYQDLNNKLVNSKMTIESPEYARNLRKTGKNWQAENKLRSAFLSGESDVMPTGKYNKDLMEEYKGLLAKGNREAYVKNLDERFGVKTNEAGVHINAPQEEPASSGSKSSGLLTSSEAAKKAQSKTELDMKTYVDMSDRLEKLKQLLRQPSISRTKSYRIKEAQKILGFKEEEEGGK